MFAQYGAQRPCDFPRTRELLDCSVVLFSQQRPFIAQTSDTVGEYADALVKVWYQRDVVASAAATSK